MATNKISKKTLDKKTVVKKTLDKKVSIKKTLDKKINQQKTLDKKTVVKKTLDKKVNIKKTLDKKINQQKTLDKKVNQQKILDKKTVVKKTAKTVVPTLSLSNLKTLHKPKKPKRVGRGCGSGMGKTSTAGHKGQRSRSGHKIKAFFEGGQTPFHRRIPKTRGFKSINPTIYQVVNLYKIAEEKMILVNNETLLAANLISHLQKPVKILGEGEITLPVTFQVAAISASAKKKILSVKGKILFS